METPDNKQKQHANDAENGLDYATMWRQLKGLLQRKRVWTWTAIEKTMQMLEYLTLNRVDHTIKTTHKGE